MIHRFRAAATALLAVMALACSPPAQARYTKIVVFSDSMSDTHRYYDLTKVLLGTGYPAPPAMPGRFCDGPVAVEVLGELLNAPLENYSFSGAQTGYLTLLPGVPLGILTQVNEHINNQAFIPTIATLPLLGQLSSIIPGTGRADPKALYVIWSGPDDYYGLGGFSDATAPRATRNIQQAITTLYNAGARYFFVPTMPDLAITPSARQHEKNQPGYIAKAARYSEDFSVALTKGLQASAKRYPKARIMSFDTLPFLRAEMDKGRAEGKNMVDACHPGGLVPTFEPRVACPDPENHLFWDDNHPTAAANRILGTGWAKAIIYQP